MRISIRTVFLTDKNCFHMEITPGNVMFVVAVLLFFSVLIGKVGEQVWNACPPAFWG